MYCIWDDLQSEVYGYYVDKAKADEIAARLNGQGVGGYEVKEV